MISFQSVFIILAHKRRVLQGQSVAQIAKSAQCSTSTVRRWLKKADNDPKLIVRLGKEIQKLKEIICVQPLKAETQVRFELEILK